MDAADLSPEPAAILAADNPQGAKAVRYLTPCPASFKNYKICPWAETIVFKDHETGNFRAASVTCKRWGCAYCAPRKIRKLAFLTNGAKPNRWIRLGVKPENYADPKTAWEQTSPLIPELVRKLRKQLGEIEYLRVCELHQSGFPHYHALLRSPYIHQKTLSNEWDALTGARVVWIAKIDQSFSSFRYLTKYLTKLHRIEWTDRHVSYSANFFRAEDREKLVYPPREVIKREATHPWKFLADYFPYEQIGVDDAGNWHLPCYPDMPQDDVPLHEFGLRPAPTERPTPPLKQNLMTGMEDVDVDDFSTASF